DAFPAFDRRGHLLPERAVTWVADDIPHDAQRVDDRHTGVDEDRHRAIHPHLIQPTERAANDRNAQTSPRETASTTASATTTRENPRPRWRRPAINPRGPPC